VEDANYAMFDPIGNLMVGKFLLTQLEKYYLSPDFDVETLIDFAYAVGEHFPDTEASDTAVREAIVNTLANVIAQSFTLEK
jgi:hypothetical protein